MKQLKAIHSRRWWSAWFALGTLLFGLAWLVEHSSLDWSARHGWTGRTVVPSLEKNLLVGQALPPGRPVSFVELLAATYHQRAGGELEVLVLKNVRPPASLAEISAREVFALRIEARELEDGARWRIELPGSVGSGLRQGGYLVLRRISPDSHPLTFWADNARSWTGPQADLLDPSAGDGIGRRPAGAHLSLVLGFQGNPSLAGAWAHHGWWWLPLLTLAAGLGSGLVLGLIRLGLGAAARPREAAFYAALLLLLAAVPSGCLEGYYRLFGERVDLDALTGKALGPSPWAKWAVVDAFSAFRTRPNYSAPVGDSKATANSYGFPASPELPPVKAEKEIRIAFLGGSATAGQWLADEQTWPRLVAEMVQRRFTDRKITFLNAAQHGYCSLESYGAFWSRVRFFSPDLTVLYQGWNEMYYFGASGQMHRWRMLADGSWRFDNWVTVARCRPLWIDHFAKHSQVLSRIRRAYLCYGPGETGPAHKRTKLASTFDHRMLDVWRTNLRLFAQSAPILKSELFVAKQATLIVPGLPADQQARCKYEYHGFDHQAHVAAFQALYRVIEEEIPPDRIIDVTPLSGRPELFFDHVHPTPQGAQAIARIVGQALIRHLEEGG